jgi:hypothetical protein
VALSSNIPNTTFNWTVVPTNVTGANKGSGNTIAQTLVAASTASSTAIYTITPIADGCQGTPIHVTVTVKAPSPPVDLIGFVKKSKSSKQDSTHVLKIVPAVDSTIVGYRLYQGKDLVRTFSANSTLEISLNHRSRNKSYRYKVVSINAFDVESTPLKLTLP